MNYTGCTYTHIQAHAHKNREAHLVRVGSTVRGAVALGVRVNQNVT
jgi:hypothetical protein